MSFVLTPLAEHDLNEIWEYLAKRDLDLADQIVEEIFENLTGLEQKRLFGHPRPDLADEKPLLFKVLCRRYVVVYRSDFSPLTVICIAGATQDLTPILAER